MVMTLAFQDVTHAKMRRRIENPRIVLLDCNLEYKKGESQTSLEIMKEEDISRILEQVSRVFFSRKVSSQCCL